ncbi:MAG TPA: UPF0182 family protein [Gemmatimonadaceae bacterium]|nr:UPF0182 family protein [Gemmatimonadaceae bacterium]
MTRKRRLWLSLAVVALGLLVGRGLSGAYAEYRWFDALGASDVWRLQFVNASLLRVLAFVAGTGIAFVNFWGVRHSVVSLVLPRRLGGIEIGEEVPPSHLMAVVVMLSVIVGFAFAIPAGDWQSMVFARGGVPFDEADPYFSEDIGFFVYWLPFERAAYAWTVSIVMLVSVLVIGLYALTPSLKWERGRIHVSTYVRRHVSVIGGVSLALLAWSFRLDAYDTVLNGSGADGMYNGFDHQLGVPISLWLAYLAIGSSIAVAWAGWNGQSRVALTVMTVVLLLTPTLKFALPVAVSWATTPVDPALRDRAFIANRAAFTRRGFAVDRIRFAQAGEALRSPQDAAYVSVWDPAALERALEYARRRGPFVGAPTLTMTRTGPVFVALESSAPASGATTGTWASVRALSSFTDERGAVVRVDETGRFPLDETALRPPLVYPRARGHLVVQDTLRPPAAPQMNSFVARLAEAWNVQNFRLLSSSLAHGRMVRRRDVRERVAALLPFFTLGSAEYPIAQGDSVLWAVELYTANANYPIGRKFAVTSGGEVNYFRHAGTALVNAHTGRVTVQMDESPDPIARTWISHLTTTLARPTSLMPSLLAQLPPDVEGADKQAAAFAAAGSRSEGAARRNLPRHDGSDSLAMSRYPTIVWMPSIGASVWTTPLVDPDDRVSGVLVATGGAHRETLWFRSTDSSTTWAGLLERLQRAAQSGDARDPQASGRVRLLPLANGGLLAVQPFYAWPDDRSPYVHRVAVALRDTATAATSIARAVGAPVRAGPEPANPDAKAERLRALYEEMRAALRRGDLAAFGAAFDAMGALLDRRQ